MELKQKFFETPRTMLKPYVYRCVSDFINQCEFYQLFNVKLEFSELRWLVFIKERIDSLVSTSPNFGGNMKKCLCGYIKLLPKIQKLLQNDPV